MDCCNAHGSVQELVQILKELLQMEELDLGDHSQLPKDHPVARAERWVYAKE
jgi:hypothetical protein